LALTELGATDLKLYDGSWAEWGASGREIQSGG
jgi:3-mercaptopyruvate sulfurtransferase SseA